MEFTKYFIKNWEERVGKSPQLEKVEEICKKSVPVQKGSIYYLENGEMHNTLSIFWHPDLDLIITLDPIRNAFISVLSRENWQYNQKDTKGDSNGSN